MIDDQDLGALKLVARMTALAERDAANGHLDAQLFLHFIRESEGEEEMTEKELGQIVSMCRENLSADELTVLAAELGKPPHRKVAKPKRRRVVKRVVLSPQLRLNLGLDQPETHADRAVKIARDAGAPSY